MILIPSRQLDNLSDDPLEAEFEKRAIMDFEQPVRKVDAEIWVDSDQVCIESRLMELRQRQAVRDERLPQLLVRVHDDASRIEQSRLRDARDRAPSTVGGEDRISEACLMEPCLHLSKRVAALWCVRWRCFSRDPHNRPKRQAGRGGSRDATPG
jgi:hypothetical protein